MKFEWLQDYMEMQNHIAYLKKNLVRTERELWRWTYGDLSKIKLEKGSRATRLEEIIESLKQEIEITENRILDIEQFIYSLDGLESQIVRMKYIENKSLKEIAEITGYEYGYIRVKHASIKRTINFANSYREKIESKNVT
ncbi:sigma-70 family RNA polymerase sigma factor [Enterococcus cecorum]|uniref:sigma-70 family RNA polymerase sigma factor n=1 Tax=Enterococcus cecorum TaxID=44008 RepID=UPI00148CABE6|nr:sigma-70 family RNA polymerase sigma factor [Enterococcus cecorum]CAI3297434.1 sigma-70 family RNA polymerase sigma factor [Enterococcus cecorum]CAI3372852.1 sigma-70 family RNA polymerase sigma factor [Enterococcus cecorum]CAI3455599.1 sigma-70 family RNA polymerase sigma factor [Enterococcus cecorum]